MLGLHTADSDESFEETGRRSAENCACNQAAKNDDDPKDYLGVQPSCEEHPGTAPICFDQVTEETPAIHAWAHSISANRAPTRSTMAEAAVSCGMVTVPHRAAEAQLSAHLPCSSPCCASSLWSILRIDPSHSKLKCRHRFKSVGRKQSYLDPRIITYQVAASSRWVHSKQALDFRIRQGVIDINDVEMSET